MPSREAELFQARWKLDASKSLVLLFQRTRWAGLENYEGRRPEPVIRLLLERKRFLSLRARLSVAAGISPVFGNRPMTRAFGIRPPRFNLLPTTGLSVCFKPPFFLIILFNFRNSCCKICWLRPASSSSITALPSFHEIPSGLDPPKRWDSSSSCRSQNLPLWPWVPWPTWCEGRADRQMFFVSKLSGLHGQCLGQPDLEATFVWLPNSRLTLCYAVRPWADISVWVVNEHIGFLVKQVIS